MSGVGASISGVCMVVLGDNGHQLLFHSTSQYQHLPQVQIQTQSQSQKSHHQQHHSQHTRRSSMSSSPQNAKHPSVKLSSKKRNSLVSGGSVSTSALASVVGSAGTDLEDLKQIGLPRAQSSAGLETKEPSGPPQLTLTSSYSGSSGNSTVTSPTTGQVSNGSKIAKNYPFRKIYGIPPVAFARLCVPQKSLCDKGSPFVVTIDEKYILVSCPLSIPQGNTSREVALFNIAVILSKTVKQPPNARARLSSLLKEIFKELLRLSMSLKFEQCRSDFLSVEVANILDVRERMTRNVSFDEGPAHDVEGINMFGELLVQNSVLAVTLQKFFISLESSTSVEMKLNNLLSLSINFSQFSGFETGLKPYQSLILLSNVSELCEELNGKPDSSKALIRFISFITPLKSFQDACLELDMPLGFVFCLAEHLIQWNKARVINTLTKHSLYVSAPRQKGRPVSSYAASFRVNFPNHSIFDVLSRFATVKRLEDHLKNLNSAAQHDMLRMIVWLLQRQLLCQANVYIFLLHSAGISVDSQILEEPSAEDSAPQVATKEHEEEYVPSSFLNRKSISRRTNRLFRRLVRYFNGTYHIEEIMWSENVSRTEMMQVLQDFSDILAPCTCIVTNWDSLK
jgi:hypothetical protein